MGARAVPAANHLHQTDRARLAELADHRPAFFSADRRLWLGGHDRLYRLAFETCLADWRAGPTGPVDLIVILAQTPDEATYFARKHRPRLVPGGVVWIVQAGSAIQPGAAPGEPGDPRGWAAELHLQHETSVALGEGRVSSHYRA